MNPEIWGPPAWMFLHSVSLAYPKNPTEEDRINYSNFFNSLQQVLPCHKCSNNYLHHIQEDPVENNLNNKESLVKWLINLHNKVNKLNNKNSLSYDNTIDKYKNIYSLKNNDSFNKENELYPQKKNNKILLYLFIFLILMLCGLYIYRNYYKK